MAAIVRSHPTNDANTTDLDRQRNHVVRHHSEMVSDFVPFDATPEDIEARQVLRDGVPDTMRSSLVGWIGTQVLDRGWGQVHKLRDIENNCEVSLGLGTSPALTGDLALGRFYRLVDRDLLMTVHYLLSRSPVDGRATAGLERVLADGRSRWRVGKTSNNTWGLVARVPRGVQEAAETVIAQSGGRVSCSPTLGHICTNSTPMTAPPTRTP